MFERPQSGERAILVHLTIHQLAPQPELAEFVELARSAGVSIVGQLTGSRQTPESNYFIGEGKLEQLTSFVQAEQAEVVLFNHTLSPSQERNLEKVLQCRVLDRTGVILDIFAQRARSFEGKLQVELAQLKHLSTRLIRGWTHLERQKGGIGLRGPGETQLEADRRYINERIKQLNKRLTKVTQQRDLSRRARQRKELPVVSLVGYTNAGKSTLFNQLTQAKVYAADQLFATLDATLRRIELPNKTPVILADTVGFIQHLPHDLVAAFRATLEETRQADLILHVVDANDPERLMRIEQVNSVLKEMDAQAIPQLLVYNKIDQLSEKTMPYVEYDATGHVYKIWLSALFNQGLDLLQQALATYFQKHNIHCWVRIPLQAQTLRAQIFSKAHVFQEQYAENGDSLLEISMQTHQLSQLSKKEPAFQIIDN